MIASTNSDIRTSKGQAWGAFWKMKRVFKSKIVPLPLKINIFKAAVLAILLYCCESWILTENLEPEPLCYKLLQNHAQHQTSWQEAKRGHLQDGRPRTTSRDSPTAAELKFLGHCLRKDEYVLYEPRESHGKRSRGKPRMLYPKYVGRLINSSDPHTASEIRRMAQDRIQWRQIVVD